MTIILIVLALFLSFPLLRSLTGTSANEDTYHFIDEHMRNPNGTFATYLQEDTEEDADEVQGKETLSETVGLWMEYAIVTEDRERFEEAYRQLNRFFLDSEGFVYWKLSAEGEQEEYINALIDDVRIIRSLWAAYDLWEDEKFRRTADEIGGTVGSNNVFESVMIDFYDKSIDYPADFLTTSYISADDMAMLLDKGYITPKVYDRTVQVLKDMPIDNGFYPKTYSVELQKMVYDQEINMIDQLIVAINAPETSEPLAGFIKKEMEEKGILHGVYSRTTKEPLVDYESPAIYALVITYAVKTEDKELALFTYDRLIEFRETGSEYRGAYSVGEDENTHIFDNLLPMIAIERLKKEGWVKQEGA
ncbi:glycosyl hydrolase [Salimicrobium sp. PL1-032A]|uniref:glycosyl hydrolase family 8 n=1 Tax=Salimicrobium sp. PL1-032A TaxID=3095364 RepID=UPI0032605658